MNYFNNAYAPIGMGWNQGFMPQPYSAAPVTNPWATPMPSQPMRPTWNQPPNPGPVSNPGSMPNFWANSYSNMNARPSPPIMPSNYPNPGYNAPWMSYPQIQHGAMAPVNLRY